MTATDSCESLWKTAAPRSADDLPYHRSWRLGASAARGRRARALAPSKIEAVIPRQRLQRCFGPSSEMLDHLGSGQRPQPRRRAIFHAPRQSDQETRGEEIAGTGGIDHPLDRARRNRIGFLAGHDQTSLLAAGDHCKPHIVAQRIDCSVEISGLVEAVQLALIGEDDIDRAGADEIEE